MKKIGLPAITTFLLLSANAQTGNVGIGTTTPQARLHVADSSVVFSANADVLTTPGSPPVIGPGRRMMWYADKAAFRAGYVSGIQWAKNNIGNYSFAAGNDVMASGLQSVAFGYSSQALTAESFAMGNNAVASGLGARAMGLNITASGDQSTAIGYNNAVSGGYAVALGSNNVSSGFNSTAIGGFTVASGDYSSSFGRFTRSKSYGGIVLGIFNDSANAASATAINSNNRIFQIGNGTADNARRNAITVLQNGNTGVGTVNPMARLHVADSNVLFFAQGNLPATAGTVPPMTFPGRRVFWYADLSAFRAECSNAIPGLDVNNIGRYSFAAGCDNVASGDYAVAFGGANLVHGIRNFAAGYNNILDGNYSAAFGSYNEITADYGFASGTQNQVTDDYGFAFGSNNLVSGNRSFAGGSGSKAIGFRSFAFGMETKANGPQSVAFGSYTHSSNEYGSFTCGSYNDTTNAATSTRIFEIGNGTSDATRGNAITVLLNGNTGVSTLVPEVKMDINGDLAYRQNVITLNNGLNSNVDVGKFSFVKITGPNAAFSIDGIQGGVDGKILTIYNLTASNMTIVNDGGSVSTAVNRINTLEGGGNISTINNGSVTLQYSAADNRWMVIGMKQ